MRTVFDLDKKEQRLEKLEKQTQKPNFWNNQEEAAEINRELSDIKEDFKKTNELKKELEDLKEISRLSEKDEKIKEELEKRREDLEKKIEKEEFRIFLSSPRDKGSALITLYSGAGGVDAQDWTTLLLRMYERYCQKQGFKTTILYQSFGEPGGPEGRIGIKQASFEVEGKYAYGFLKKESGVHRLVRISPFSAQKLRHTSFALVEVLPFLPKETEKEIEISPKDLKIDTFRASGPGGQYVNRRESAVRITHLPSGIVTVCQLERLQGLNKARAMEMLYAKLYQKKLEEQKKTVSKIKGEAVSVSWGNQIRSYVLHPYKIVKDLRTGVETSDVEAVLDGELDQFIEAEIKITN